MTSRQVGRFAAAAGIYDQAGNVLEWLADTFTRDYSDTACWGTAPRTDPICNTTASSMKSRRGGSLGSVDAAELRPATRLDGLGPVASGSNLGFRCVRSR